MLGKIAPYAVIGFLDFLLVLAAMYLVFGVPIAGSVRLLLLLSVGFLLAALGLGLARLERRADPGAGDARRARR